MEVRATNHVGTARRLHRPLHDVKPLRRNLPASILSFAFYN
ncbi:hypothetical protein FHX12_002751 [Rhizobium sp. BK609]|nr:hypothetical protein [Rhizobium sp. BK098]MBB3569168.1 hypothetical protein [Rhizobium sp. BK491]MBB3615770.1 hypothetical protein [Rhizobium sp. BK609]MBB3681429.1 hypothetical protein [Rhizobium sp. BK612]